MSEIDRAIEHFEYLNKIKTEAIKRNPRLGEAYDSEIANNRTALTALREKQKRDRIFNDSGIDKESARDCIRDFIEHFDELGFYNFYKTALEMAYALMEDDDGQH